MRVTFVIQDLFSQGAQYATALMARGFVAAGYDVDLIVSKVHSDLLSEGKTPFAVPAPVVVKTLHNRRARNNIRELRQYLRHTNSVAVVSMSPNYTWALRLASLGLWQRPKMIHVEHGLAGLSYGKVIEPPRMFSRAGLLHRFLFHGYDRVLTVSAAGKLDFLRYYPFYPKNRVAVVYNPVVDEAFYKKVKYPPQHPWLLDKKCPTFVSAGAYQEYKGHFDLLEAVRSLKDREKFRIIVFGDGPLLSRYDEYIAANGLQDMITFAGYTNNFPAEAKASDGFVLSSRRESFGIVLVEALASGCPMLSTDAPFGPREILEDGRYGKLVPVRNPVCFAEGIVDLIHHRIPKASDESWRRFTVEMAVARYEKGIGLK